jgi:UDP-N-acetyl-D-glucosamine dehydrogenase
VIRLLAAKGANVSYHDPHVPEVQIEGWSGKSIEATDEAVASADLVVILTHHAAVDYERLVAKAHRVYDTRNATRAVREGREKIRKL